MRLKHSDRYSHFSYYIEDQNLAGHLVRRHTTVARRRTQREKVGPEALDDSAGTCTAVLSDPVRPFSVQEVRLTCFHRSKYLYTPCSLQLHRFY